MTYEVLLIEDDPMVANVNRGYVQEVRGFRIAGWARTAADGLRLVKELQPQLVLLDIYLPGGDGVQVLKKLRQQEVLADVIVVSAAQDSATIQSILRLGAIDYIIKPFRFERLKEALETYRGRRDKLGGGGELQQNELDRVIHGRKADNDEPPKGLNRITLDLVQQLLRSSTQPVTAALAAEQLGLSRVTARRYLDFLVKVGAARVDAQYGTVGRPVNRYTGR